MRDYLKTYKITLTAKGAVFIGSGSSITKKEYILNTKTSTVHIPDSLKLFKFLTQKGLEKAYEKYLLGNDKDLGGWLRNNGITERDYSRFVAYSLDCGDVEDRLLEVMQFVKDAYKNPYIPGSSLKGALRTVILAKLINDNSRLKSDAQGAILTADYTANSRRLLSREVGTIESKAFNTAGRNMEKPNDAVNSIMTGLRISDSEPLSLSDLTICEKKDYNRHGEKKPINFCRECLKPGTKISFDLTVDSTIFKHDENFIREAIALFIETYNNHFNSKFKEGDALTKNSLFLGGGCGFVSKTIIYSTLGERGVATTGKILSQLFRNHYHGNDHKKGVSPTLIKRTSYKRTNYSFGLCEVEITPI